MSKLQIAREDLLEIASEDRILTSDILRTNGISPTVQARLVRNEALHPLTTGVYSAGPPCWRGYVAAGLYVGGADAAAYGTTSLALHGLADPECPVHILTPRTSQRQSQSWVTFHRSALDVRRVLDQHPLRRIGLEDSILDALGQLDEVSAIALVTRAIQERRTTPQRLLALFDARARVAHRKLVRSILLDGAGIESALEHAYATRVEGPHGLEPMQRQFIVPETGHRADGAYPQSRALFHLDGARYHDREADRVLDIRHAAFRYSSSRITWHDCWIQPCTTAQNIAGGEVPRRCRKCPTR